LNSFGPGRVAGVEGDEDVHTAAPGVDDTGVQFDEFTDADRPVEVHVANVGGDAVATAPLRRSRRFLARSTDFEDGRTYLAADHAAAERPSPSRR